MPTLSLPDQPVAIALEGIDGCGKTTQASELAGVFHAAGRTVVSTRQPGGTSALQVRDILLHSPELCSKARHLLFAADNAQHTQDFLLPSLSDGKDVIIDRCIGSAYAYQGWGENYGLERVKLTYDWATDNFTPTLTVLMDMDPAEVLQRKATNEDDNDGDVIEKFGIDFQWRVYRGYLELERQFDNWVMVPLSTSLSVEETTGMIVDAINSRLSS